MRSRLEWVVQGDDHSCGPLAVAAALLLLQGFRPTAQSVQTARIIAQKENHQELNRNELGELRRRLLLIWLDAASGVGVSYPRASIP